MREWHGNLYIGIPPGNTSLLGKLSILLVTINGLQPSSTSFLLMLSVNFSTPPKLGRKFAV